MMRQGGRRVAEAAPRKRTRRRKPSRLNTQQKILVAIAGMLAVTLLLVVAYQKIFVRPELPVKTPDSGTADTGAGQEEYIDYGDGLRPAGGGERKSQDFYTVLVLGRDTAGGGNTDTMLLASYDVTNQKATVMSIPRDTMVNIRHDVKKINAVYNYGGGGEKGIQDLYKEISQLVGFEPDFRVVVEWDAVGKIVDAMGGVWFDNPYPMDYHDPYQDLVIEQEQGYRLFNGEDAMALIRWRKNDLDSPYGYINGIGDSGRMKLQQDFLKAVIKQMMTPANVKNVGKIAEVFEQSVDTDLSFQNILWFGKQAFSGGLSLDAVNFVTMPWQGAEVFSRSYSKEFGYPFYLAYVVPVPGQLLDIVNNQLSPYTKTFNRSDLDIMYVNSDGSIGSTAGYVEDSIAAQPPDLSPYQEEDPGYVMDENGNLVDPESGEIISTEPLPEDPNVTGDPNETDGPGTTTGPVDPDVGTDDPQPEGNDQTGEATLPPEEEMLPPVTEQPTEIPVPEEPEDPEL